MVRFFISALLLIWQTPDLPPDVLFLAKARRHIREGMTNLPNYTCLETIARGQLTPPARTFRRLDLVRVEVAKAGGRELFAWPGAGNFEEKPISDFVGAGLIGDGMFSLFADEVFVNNTASLKVRGSEPLDGKPAMRVDYTVSPLFSHFTLTTADGSALIDSAGSFWIDPVTLDPIRLEVEGLNLPPALRISGLHIGIDFQVLNAGERAVVLARHSSIVMEKTSGQIERDDIEFSGCRRFSGDAQILSEDEAPAAAGAAAAPHRTFTLPGDLTMNLRLNASIFPDRASVGDAVSATLESDVRDKHRIWLPKGAAVQGRVRRLEDRQDSSRYVLAGIEFSEARAGNDTFRFIAELENVRSAYGIVMHYIEKSQVSLVRGMVENTTTHERYDGAMPGVGYLYLVSAPFRVPEGFESVWRTQSVRESN